MPSRLRCLTASLSAFTMVKVNYMVHPTRSDARAENQEHTFTWQWMLFIADSLSNAYIICGSRDTALRDLTKLALEEAIESFCIQKESDSLMDETNEKTKKINSSILESRTQRC